MSIVSINKEALISAKDAIEKYKTSMKNAISKAISSFQALYGEWQDEDFNDLMSALNSIENNINVLESACSQIISRIKTKIEQINQLHSMQI
jgi:archaellum component FlaC